MKVLAFDTSSKALSLAILEDKQVLAETTINIKKNHSITLMPAIDFLMASLDWTPKDLDRIVVAEGPGSYTGLRIAVATAKTLAHNSEHRVGWYVESLSSGSIPTRRLVRSFDGCTSQQCLCRIFMKMPNLSCQKHTCLLSESSS